MDFFSILKLVLGLSFFLFGMNVMSANLEKLAGGRLENSLKKMTSNPLLSMVVGAGITIAMQSSSATTVMLVGLVNSGIMHFSQTLYVIFGANIGTTLTAWILSLSGISSDNFAIQMLKPENFSPVLAIAGVVLLMMGKTDKKKSIGTIFAGFAVLMYGMEFMKESVSPLAELPAFTDMLVKFSNPVLGVLIGVVVTAVIQSSAASIGILQALSLTGSISCGIAIPIIMGQNIGTCATSLLSCIGTNTNAKRVAAVHASIKVIGMLICLPLYIVADRALGSHISSITANPANIALIHTVFNVVITIILMPCSKLLVKLVNRIVREKAVESDEKKPIFTLDDLLLRSPSVAVSECDSYTSTMAIIAQDAILDSFRLLDGYDKNLVNNILAKEDDLDSLEDSLGSYLVKLSTQAVSDVDSRRVSKMLHAIGDFERLGDHAVNLLKVAQEMYDKKIAFSDEAKRELTVLRDAAIDILNLTVKSYLDNDIALAAKVEPLEQVIDRLTSQIRSNHISRLQSGNCTIEMGFILSDTLTNFERISDHCSNIAVAVTELYKGSFDTHRYLNSIKSGSDEFAKIFDEYDAQYSLNNM
ncbi:MAG: Na/Pi cotransporter family protein [Clostridia bacterium]|nr:Na/Pi cotransporter family protein [Clostridia bacterium]